MLRQLTLCLALFTAAAATDRAQARDAGAPYGERLARAEARWPDAAPAAPLMPAAPATDSDRPALELDDEARNEIAQLEARVRELEDGAGPYAVGLHEPLADLARRYVSLGRPAQALALYQRSLHVLRVNAGLGDPAQMAVLREMLRLHRAAGDRAALDDLYAYYYRLGWLLAGGPEGGDWQVALESLRWQREWLRGERGDPSGRLLDLYQRNADLIEAADGAPFAVRRDLALSQLRNLYLLRDRIVPLVEERSSVLGPRPLPRQQPFPQDPGRERLLRIRRSAQAEGESLLEALLEDAPDASERAALQRQMGDWAQWNGNWYAAVEAWQAAIATLEAAGETERIADWFGEPVELPDNGAFWQPAAEDVSLVRIRFRVSRRGLPRELDSALLSGRDGARIVGARELRGVRFRPRFSDGEPVDSDSLERDYEVYPR